MINFIGWRPGPETKVKVARRGSQNMSLKDIPTILESQQHKNDWLIDLWPLHLVFIFPTVTSKSTDCAVCLCPHWSVTSPFLCPSQSFSISMVLPLPLPVPSFFCFVNFSVIESDKNDHWHANFRRFHGPSRQKSMRRDLEMPVECESGVLCPGSENHQSQKCAQSYERGTPWCGWDPIGSILVKGSFSPTLLTVIVPYFCKFWDQSIDHLHQPIGIFPFLWDFHHSYALSGRYQSGEFPPTPIGWKGPSHGGRGNGVIQ